MWLLVSTARVRGEVKQGSGEVEGAFTVLKCNSLVLKGRTVCVCHLTGAESDRSENNPVPQVFAQLVQLGTAQGVSQAGP